MMNRKLAWILAIAMIISLLGTATISFAAPDQGGEAIAQGESAGETEESAEGESVEGESAEGVSAESEGDSETGAAPVIEPDYSAVQDYEYAVVEADGEQIQLTYVPGVTTILEVDGLKFKDMNKNGELDPYEDWRLDADTRIDDLFSQMTIEEKTGLFYHICSCGSSNGADFSLPQNIWGPDADTLRPEDGHSMYFYITNLDITHFLDNSNGTPQDQTDYHNAIQSIGERTRLGIPITFSSDRQYNAWGGMIDTPHDSFGTAADIELGIKLWEQYAAETRAIGYHVPFHPYGMEIGSWNGENPEYMAQMTTAEVSAIEKYMQACAKHFIARGGDSNFKNARSDAQTVDNWMYPWQAAIDCGIQWIMLNADSGLTNSVPVDFDKFTLDYLREELGYEGITLSDWGTEGPNNAVGIGNDGTDISTLTTVERYAYAVNAGLDQIGFPNTAIGVTSEDPSPTAPSHRDAIQAAYEQGLITDERMEATCRRVLKSKFTLGLFENPYCDPAAALALAANEEYIAEPWPITDLESLNRARNQEIVDLERQLEAASAVLIKNDDALLPLEKGINVYIDTTASTITKDGYLASLAEYATVVDDIEAADVVVADCTQVNDAAELIVEDAQDAGKKIVIVANCVDPDVWMLENADAVLYVDFSRTPDHGTGEGGFILTIEPCVFADLLFGVREPNGMIVKEIARDSASDNAQWKDLAGDQGADNWTRMILLALMKTNEDHSVPENFGDPLLCFKYGMHYGEEPEFIYDTLVLPKSTTEVTEETSSGTSTSYQTIDGIKAGEPFSVYTLLWNNGADGITTVEAAIDGGPAAEKIMAVNGGSWRIVKMDLVIDEAGEHTVTVGDITKTITVE